MGHDWEKVKDSDDIHLVGWFSDRRYGLQWRHMQRLQWGRIRNDAGKGLEKHITRSVEHLRDGCFEDVLLRWQCLRAVLRRQSGVAMLLGAWDSSDVTWRVLNCEGFRESDEGRQQHK